jgi:hypothetical protein
MNSSIIPQRYCAASNWASPIRALAPGRAIPYRQNLVTIWILGVIFGNEAHI